MYIPSVDSIASQDISKLTSQSKLLFQNLLKWLHRQCRLSWNLHHLTCKCILNYNTVKIFRCLSDFTFLKKKDSDFRNKYSWYKSCYLIIVCWTLCKKTANFHSLVRLSLPTKFKIFSIKQLLFEISWLIYAYKFSR